MYQTLASRSVGMDSLPDEATMKTMQMKIFLAAIFVFLGGGAWAEQTAPVGPALKAAVTCERIKDGQPLDQTVVFDTAKASAYCWCYFDPVSSDSVIYFEWYRNETLAQKEKRSLRARPGGWATYSSLKIRQADIGPWHVNITDETGKILSILRFSVTE